MIGTMYNIQYKCKSNLSKMLLVYNWKSTFVVISSSKIELVNQLKDLSTIFYPKLNFSFHTKMIEIKAFCDSVFIKRTCGSFSDSVP